MNNPQAQTSDELETVEAQNSLFDLLYDCSARAVTTRLGQFVYRRVDGLLSTAEKTARWSLPQQIAPSAEDDPGKISAPPLIRPLPWILFLPALIGLRLARIALSFLALMVGKPPVSPATVVCFLQNKRRKLRALKYRGQRLNRISRAESSCSGESRSTWLNRVTLPLRSVVSARTAKPSSKPAADYRQHQKHVAQKRNAEQRDDGDSDDSFNAHCMELLEKYANAAGDSSYNAEEASSESSDSSISERENSISEEEAPNGHPEPSTIATATTTGDNINGHADPAEKPIVASTQPTPAVPNAPEKLQEKSSLNVNNNNKAAETPAIAKVNKSIEKPKPFAMVETIAENGSSDASEKQDSRNNNNSVMYAKSPNAVAVEAPKGNQTSMSEVKSNYQQKNKQQPSPQSHQQQQHHHQQAHTITANGGSGAGRKQKRPNQNYS
ncbi:uncharacterized protein LOC131690015 [Topomyia yanbarensis]|uniref:uncharacterized protein LOC131690015 n=1 Tax=Topomyia yanbarensis TaxID=2498891 RepID=UPI00273BF149|nr:uncharacterized protein LOC131690015 [Topomyia yanbarensis]